MQFLVFTPRFSAIYGIASNNTQIIRDVKRNLHISKSWNIKLNSTRTWTKLELAYSQHPIIRGQMLFRYLVFMLGVYCKIKQNKSIWFDALTYPNTNNIILTSNCQEFDFSKCGSPHETAVWWNTTSACKLKCFREWFRVGTSQIMMKKIIYKITNKNI